MDKFAEDKGVTEVRPSERRNDSQYELISIEITNMADILKDLSLTDAEKEDVINKSKTFANDIEDIRQEILNLGIVKDRYSLVDVGPIETLQEKDARLPFLIYCGHSLLKTMRIKMKKGIDRRPEKAKEFIADGISELRKDLDYMRFRLKMLKETNSSDATVPVQSGKNPPGAEEI